MKIKHKSKICFKELSDFYVLRQHKTSELGNHMKSPGLDVNNRLEDDDADLREEIQASQHFLVDSELEKGRHRAFSFAMSTIDISLINSRLDLVFIGLKCASEVNHAIELFSKTLIMDRIDIIMLTRTIRLWRGGNLCVRQMTLPT